MNLKERSSGSYPGQLTITKRGPSVARRYLYLATLRWIVRDPQAAEWYRRKVQRDGGLKGPVVSDQAIIALTRKLTKALGHVARGPSASIQPSCSTVSPQRWRASALDSS